MFLFGFEQTRDQRMSSRKVKHRGLRLGLWLGAAITMVASLSLLKLLLLALAGVTTAGEVVGINFGEVKVSTVRGGYIRGSTSGWKMLPTRDVDVRFLDRAGNPHRIAVVDWGRKTGETIYVVYLPMAPFVVEAGSLSARAVAPMVFLPVGIWMVRRFRYKLT